MYSVFVAADCNGEKLNLQFLFEDSPSVSQVLNRSTDAFASIFLQRGLRRSFAISAAVIYNDVHQTWDRLERSTQLLHNAQVYLFQPDVVDVPSEIADPVPASLYLGTEYRSPSRTNLSQSPRAAVPSSYDPRPTSTMYSSPSVSIYGGSNPIGVGSHNPYNLANTSQSRYSTSQPRTLANDNVSIIRQEREKLEQQSHLSLDELRGVLKNETKSFSASPDRR